MPPDPLSDSSPAPPAPTTTAPPPASTASGTDIAPSDSAGLSLRRRATTKSEEEKEKAAEAARAARLLAFKRKYRHVAAVHHKVQPTVLSHDALVAPSFLGFRNLMVIVLVVGNLRLMMENIQKYGVLICFSCHNFPRSDVFLGIGLYFLIPCHLFVAYLIELVAARRAITEHRFSKDGPSDEQRRRFQTVWRIVAFLHAVNMTFLLVATTLVVYYRIFHPLIGTLTEFHAIIVWLKTASYALTNRDLRHAYLHPAKSDLAKLPPLYDQCPYPRNVTMSSLVYFWWAPTLVYQPVYPRTERIRWVFVAKRLSEAFFLSVFIWFMSAQYAVPVLNNSLPVIRELDMFSILERLLKLSTISLVIWLAGFFALFQSSLNALAEIMCFGDRSFYDDWWNSDSLGMYWRTWNKPVNQFFRRHLYSPLVGRGWGAASASGLVFFLSAVLHELLVGVPTHNIIGVAFLGMFIQIPLILLTQPLEKMKSPTGKLLGNSIFWVSFTIFGQPFAALMYFYAWQAKYGSMSGHKVTHF
ncbi:hypothetical protein TD95_004110 [Thielaviopsis punctulata]|uniref:O-acyltransferase n=1 Tax=Thielaviopsis punctulata TaxID=72032 RepID=A0A0F4ZK77_9PEZI|nr:hypothetical protein TD95_004110 [Thielaviopsis punctulata]